MLKVLRLVPLVLILAACSSVKVPISPYRIDVQQGNALEQEAVEKLKPGLTRSQVRFLLGTPLLADPFHGNRWDYVYNYRKAGKLTEARRLALYFDGDVLVRIEGAGLAPQAAPPQDKSAQKPAEPPAKSAEAGPNETTVVPPLQSAQSRPAAPLSEGAAEPVVLKPAADVAAIRPAVTPEFPKAPAPSLAEEQVRAALKAWTEAWRARDADRYLAAYAPSFRPEAGLGREEWEKRRRQFLKGARNIDLQIDNVATEVVAEDRVQVSFSQFYRSGAYQDAVIKQLKFVRADKLWLIEEEKVLAPIKVKK